MKIKKLKDFPIYEKNGEVSVRKYDIIRVGTGTFINEVGIVLCIDFKKYIRYSSYERGKIIEGDLTILKLPRRVNDFFAMLSIFLLYPYLWILSGVLSKGINTNYYDSAYYPKPEKDAYEKSLLTITQIRENKING